MFNTYYENYRFMETLPSYPLTLLFSYILVSCTWSQSASCTRMQHASGIWLTCSFVATFDWFRALCAACWVYIKDHFSYVGDSCQHIVSIKVVHRFEPRNCPLPSHCILVVTVSCMFIPLLNTTEAKGPFCKCT